jgi:immune inhibitor A
MAAISEQHPQGEEEESLQASLRMQPLSPWQRENYYADYQADLNETGAIQLSFSQYLALTGKVRHTGGHRGVHGPVLAASGNASSATPASPPSLVAVPERAMNGPLKVKVLLIDFPDMVGTQPAKYYERMLFSSKVLPSGSMRDYYREVSSGKLEVTGTVDGWIRMPQPYSYYTNEESGMKWGSYPRNAPRMAEDAVRAALKMGVLFSPDLDAFGNKSITALFLINAGPGAEVLPQRQGLKNIWSHKWGLRTPVLVNATSNLFATTYLTVPEDCLVGVCCHELGHLAMGWDDFYDPSYDQDGKYWDGAGNWDLMASGSYGGGGKRPVHPVGVHKAQHGWVRKQVLNVSTLTAPKKYTLFSFVDPTNYSVLELRSPVFSDTQSLLLECRKKTGFDSELPGEGLLVWRVDTRQSMDAPDFPALLLVQADGKHQLEDGRDGNQGDGGDPFPGTSRTPSLLDTGNISTSFPGATPSRILIANITRDSVTGSVSFTGDVYEQM